ncbi:MAG: hypothetical protein ABR543_10845 [Gemmatimonadaceae bacterium]
MSKMDLSFDPNEYAPVADRITQFYETYSIGRIVSDLVERDTTEITFRARVYRTTEESRPAATGWASEKLGDGDINEVACLENTETSAIGRALANLGFTASRKRASYEEMLKAARARVRLAVKEPTAPVEAIAPEKPHITSESGDARDSGHDALQGRANGVHDALRLLAAAELAGMPSDQAAELRLRLRDHSISLSMVASIERRVRQWLMRAQSTPLSPGTGPGTAA